MFISSDFLVIGSGIAGLRYALDVADRGTVAIICKSEPIEGNTRYAQGGIASVTSPLDSIEAHVEDTLRCGAGLCEEAIVRMAVEQGPHEIRRLVELGTRFDAQGGEYSLGKEGGHSARRILHAGDSTGAEIQRAVYQKAKNHPRITFYPHHLAIDLICSEPNVVSNSRQVYGCYALDRHAGTVKTFSARAVMLATGGAGKVYLYTSNPDVATGDGIAMAYRAGAQIANMEFFQFHPTCLYHPQAKTFLLTEALRGEGAILRRPDGTQFMAQYDPRAELASRDIVARAIDDQMKRHGLDCVLLDISHRDPHFIAARFPTITAQLAKFGLDLTREPIPVVPAAHYCCGGVKCDSRGRTNLARLYTAGETACTGLHGANRLASNSLLEAVVFAARAAQDTLENLEQYLPPPPPPPWDYVGSVANSQEVLVSYMWDEVRRLMWNLVGIVRSNKRLSLAARYAALIQEEISDYYWRFLPNSDLIELRNITLLANLIVQSAAARKESRGLHYNIDFPNTKNSEFRRDTVIQRDAQDLQSRSS